MDLDAKTRAVLIGEAQRMAGVLPLTMAPPRDVSESCCCGWSPCAKSPVMQEWNKQVQRELTLTEPTWPTTTAHVAAGGFEPIGPGIETVEALSVSRRHQVEALCKADKASEAVELLLADLEDVRRRLRGDGDAG